MKFMAPTFLAFSSMTPAMADAWSMGRGSLLIPTKIYSPHPTIVQEYKRLDRLFQDARRVTSPRYELVDNEDKFQLSVDVPGVKMDDINVTLEDGYLTVRGERSSSSDDSHYTSKFSQSFSLDPAVDVEKFSASLADGVLVVEAPKDMKRIEDNIIRIPVVKGETTSEADAKVAVETASSVSTDVDEDAGTLDLDDSPAVEA